MGYSLWDFFTDPILRAPTLGSMLMSFTSSLIGVIVVIRKKSLLGEALSHAAYPGVVLSVVLFAQFFPLHEEWFSFFILIGAFVSSWLGLVCIHFLQKRCKVKSDAALCFVLSSFFGLGILLASRIQISHALWYKQIQMFLYGQAATMSDVHVWMYAVLCFLALIFVTILYKEIQIINFDSQFAKSIGVYFTCIETILFMLLVLAVTIGIRSVGVVLMAGMLIAPAVAARQLTSALWSMFLLSAGLGSLSAFLGNYFSIMTPIWLEKEHFSLPTGPMILIVATGICMLSLCFAPKKGMVRKAIRRRRCIRKCEEENMLKILFKEEKTMTVRMISELHLQSYINTYYLLRRLCWKGWIRQEKKEYSLTEAGLEKASHIIKLHRLWEAYLIHLGQSKEKAHASAEEMEHVMTPDLERQLQMYIEGQKEGKT